VFSTSWVCLLVCVCVCVCVCVAGPEAFHRAVSMRARGELVRACIGKRYICVCECGCCLCVCVCLLCVCVCM
jgi:hypothetical protein